MEISNLKELSNQESEAKEGDKVKVFITNDSLASLVGSRNLERKLRHNDNLGHYVNIEGKKFKVQEMERLTEEDPIRVEPIDTYEEVIKR